MYSNFVGYIPLVYTLLAQYTKGVLNEVEKDVRSELLGDCLPIEHLHLEYFF